MNSTLLLVIACLTGLWLAAMLHGGTVLLLAAVALGIWLAGMLLWIEALLNANTRSKK